MSETEKSPSMLSVPSSRPDTVHHGSGRFRKSTVIGRRGTSFMSRTRVVSMANPIMAIARPSITMSIGSEDMIVMTDYPQSKFYLKRAIEKLSKSSLCVTMVNALIRIPVSLLIDLMTCAFAMIVVLPVWFATEPEEEPGIVAACQRTFFFVRICFDVFACLIVHGQDGPQESVQEKV